MSNESYSADPSPLVTRLLLMPSPLALTPLAAADDDVVVVLAAVMEAILFHN